MIENIPRSVVIAIKAAARDVAQSVKGGAYEPLATDKLAMNLEKFMIGMVAQSYPRKKSAWLDGDIDESWVRSAATGPLVDDEKLLKAMEKQYKDVLSPADYDMVVRNNFAKFHGKEESFLAKENANLHKEYAGSADLGLGDSGDVGLSKSPIEDLPPPPTPSKKPLGDSAMPSLPKKKVPTEEEIKPKQDLAQPGEEPLPSPLREEINSGKPLVTKI